MRKQRFTKLNLDVEQIVRLSDLDGPLYETAAQNIADRQAELSMFTDNSLFALHESFGEIIPSERTTKYTHDFLALARGVLLML